MKRYIKYDELKVKQCQTRRPPDLINAEIIALICLKCFVLLENVDLTNMEDWNLNEDGGVIQRVLVAGVNRGV